ALCKRRSGQAWGDTPTPYRYTGQYAYTEAFGLYFYNARWYDPQLGRFAQADSLIPGAEEHLAWDRYTYVSNNPLRYADPSGHCEENGDEACWGIYEQIITLCPQCSSLSRSGLRKDIPLDQDNIIYLQTVLQSVKHGWRPPSPESDSGPTVSVGVGFHANGGAGVYGDTGLYVIAIDTKGHAQMFQPFAGGGGTTSMFGEITPVLFVSNAPLSKWPGWSANVGASVEIGPSIGVDKIWFKDQQGKLYHGIQISPGVGVGATIPFPMLPIEFHAGPAYTWPPILRIK
ncbi:RHS repeat-associated core domain-containing protein, partial [Candidatus Parcubacteria bacterium]